MIQPCWQPSFWKWCHMIEFLHCFEIYISTQARTRETDCTKYIQSFMKSLRIWEQCMSSHRTFVWTRVCGNSREGSDSNDTTQPNLLAWELRFIKYAMGTCRIMKSTMVRTDWVFQYLPQHQLMCYCKNENLFDKGYNMNMNNWFSSPDDFLQLQARRANACGITRMHKKNMLPDLHERKL